MKWNRLGYYIKEGVSSVFTHGFMSFASVGIIIACLLMMGSFTLVALNVSSIIGTLEDDNQILVFVDENMTDEQARGLQTELEAIDNVSSAHFVSREEAMASFVEKYEDTTLLDDLDSSVLRDRYIIYLYDISKMADTQQQLLGVEGIVKVNAHLEISRGFIAVRNIVSAVSIALVAVLVIISLFIISNTIKLTTIERKEEIAIMKMVGATNSFIRCPFCVEGLILGITGSCMAYLAQWGIYSLISSKIVENSGLSFITVIPFGDVALPMFAAFFAVGFGVGIIGSALAIKNYLRV
ncbi:MAG: permease-like cell division protein FtsX [Oscillospiraceae bacterium]